MRLRRVLGIVLVAVLVPGYRAGRILDQLLARGDDGLTVEDMPAIQSDTTVLCARSIAETLLTQSANPFDRRYNDMIGPWRTGGTVPLPFTPAAIEAAATQTLVLQP